MNTIKYIYWQDENMWLGYLEEYPDYWAQGETIEELQEHLKDIFKELTSGNIPHPASSSASIYTVGAVNSRLSIRSRTPP